MKNLSKLLLLAITIFSVSNMSIAQEAVDLPIDEETQLITYSSVVDAQGSKYLLFDKAFRWFHSYYKNPTNVVREKNKEAGEINGIGRFKIMNPPGKKGPQTMGGIVNYKISINFKDGRYKYEISNINWKQTSYYPIEKWMDKSSKSYDKRFDFFLQEVDKNIKQLIDSLNKSMVVKEKKKDNDW